MWQPNQPSKPPKQGSLEETTPTLFSDCLRAAQNPGIDRNFKPRFVLFLAKKRKEKSKSLCFVKQNETKVQDFDTLLRFVWFTVLGSMILWTESTVWVALGMNAITLE